MKKYTKKKATQLFPGVTFYGDVRVYPRAVIGAGAVIGEGAFIGAGAFIGEGRKNVGDAFVVSGLGDTKRLTAYHCDDGLIVNIGCAGSWRGLPLDEMRKLVAKKHPPEHEYFLALDMVERWSERKQAQTPSAAHGGE